MLKTFFKRWWVINRLFHYIEKCGNELRVEEEGFILFLSGRKVLCQNGRIIRENAFFRNICPSERYVEFSNQIKTLLQECSEKRLDYINRANLNGRVYLSLKSSGKEFYSFSYLFYLFFKNTWIRLIGILLLFIFLIHYIATCKINQISVETTQNAFTQDVNRFR